MAVPELDNSTSCRLNPFDFYSFLRDCKEKRDDGVPSFGTRQSLNGSLYPKLYTLSIKISWTSKECEGFGCGSPTISSMTMAAVF